MLDMNKKRKQWPVSAICHKFQLGYPEATLFNVTSEYSCATVEAPPQIAVSSLIQEFEGDHAFCQQANIDL